MNVNSGKIDAKLWTWDYYEALFSGGHELAIFCHYQPSPILHQVGCKNSFRGFNRFFKLEIC